MAKLKIDFPDDLMIKLEKIEKEAPEIVEECLEAGAKEAYPIVLSSLKNAVGKNLKFKGRSTGELVSALGISPVKTDNSGNKNIKIGFTDGRSDGKSNEKLGNILENGKHGQPAKPWLAPAKRKAAKSITAAMEAKFEQEIEKL